LFFFFILGKISIYSKMFVSFPFTLRCFRWREPWLN
jgi:hypothetical protein